MQPDIRATGYGGLPAFETESHLATEYRLRMPPLFVSRENHADVVESVDTRDLKQN